MWGCRREPPGPAPGAHPLLQAAHSAGKCSACSCDISKTGSVPWDPVLSAGRSSGYRPSGDAGAEPLGRLSGIWKTFWETHFPEKNRRWERFPQHRRAGLTAASPPSCSRANRGTAERRAPSGQFNATPQKWTTLSILLLRNELDSWAQKRSDGGRGAGISAALPTALPVAGPGRSVGRSGAGAVLPEAAAVPVGLPEPPRPRRLPLTFPEKDGLQFQRHREAGLRAHPEQAAGGECWSPPGGTCLGDLFSSFFFPFRVIVFVLFFANCALRVSPQARWKSRGRWIKAS